MHQINPIFPVFTLPLTKINKVFLLVFLVAATPFFSACSKMQIIKQEKAIRFLGEVTIPTGTKFKDTEIGGLSGLTYDPKSKVAYAISDDRSLFAPARFYTFKVLWQNQKLSIEPQSVTFLQNQAGQTFRKNTIDPEAIVVTNDRIYISSEGYQDEKIKNFPPTIFSFQRNGNFVREHSLPSYYYPSVKKDKPYGARENLSLESLTITPSGNTIVSAMESALHQDGEDARFQNGSLVRILFFNRKKNMKLERTLIYGVDSVRPMTHEVGNIKRFGNGLVELLALSENRFLAIERGYNKIIGEWKNYARIFVFDTQFASSVTGWDSIQEQYYVPVNKKLLIDLDSIVDELEIKKLDNIEGLTFGPTLENGNRTLLLVSDNNFFGSQRTHFILLELLPEALE